MKMIPELKAGHRIKNQSQETNRVINKTQGEGRSGRETGNWPLAPETRPLMDRVRKKDLILTSREKLQRAYGGCLGAECRRRTWDTAKSLGEL